MKTILCSLLVATLPFGSVLADAPKEKNAKVTLVYQHELPNVRQEHQGRARRIWPGRLLAWSHACHIRLHLRDRSGGSDPQSGQRRTGDDLRGRRELLRAAGRPPRRQRQCQRNGCGQAPRGVRGGHERDGTDDPLRAVTPLGTAKNSLSKGGGTPLPQARSVLSARRRIGFTQP